MTTRVLYDADAKHSRKCGECTLCCKLLPVRSLDKPANERCRHQSFAQGCAVYHKPGFPFECGIWNCRWLTNEDTARLRRPDRSHYVIDTMPDFVTIVENETGKETRVEVVQIWCDPDYSDAHRDPVLREYLIRRAKEGVAALVRFSERRALHLIAPPLSSDGQWHEIEGGTVRPQHTPAELAEVIGPTKVVVERMTTFQIKPPCVKP